MSADQPTTPAQPPAPTQNDFKSEIYPHLRTLLESERDDPLIAFWLEHSKEEYLPEPTDIVQLYIPNLVDPADRSKGFVIPSKYLQKPILQLKFLQNCVIAGKTTKAGFFYRLNKYDMNEIIKAL